MTNPDIAAVAAGLTRGQIEVIVQLRGMNVKRRAINFSGTTAAALRLPTSKRPAITDRDMKRDQGKRIAWYFLTPFGRELGRYLQEQA